MLDLSLSRKILNPLFLQKKLKLLRKSGQKIVFTNGCFDLIHPGHVSYLLRAKKLGDILVVALNSDSSVKKLKGPTRPVTTLKDRAIVMAALGCVDFVTHFSKSTPLDLILTLKPDILVKGGDWKVKEIIGADSVLARGGMVRSLPFLKGKSTSRIIKKVEGEK